MIYYPAAYVAQGSAVNDSCPDCGNDRCATSMYALTEVGPVVIGLMVSCVGCGNSWRCAFCPAVLAMDGAAAHRHLATAHGG